MGMSDYLREFNKAIGPVLDAIDGAMRSGKVDPESLSEAIDSHLEWWADELAAMQGENR